MARLHPSTNSAEHFFQGQPTGLQTGTYNRFEASSSSDVAAALATGVMTSAAIFLEAGDTVTSLSFLSGVTAAGVPTAWWFALYSDAATPALLAQTANQATAAWAADTIKTLPLATPQLITRTGIYYVAIMVAATTVPSLIAKVTGRAAINGSLLSSKIIAQTSGAALTTTAPATIATPTAVVNQVWAVAT